jgi:ammonia channel protein AmtB
MFEIWLNVATKASKELICMGVYALMWAIWNYRSDIVFNKSTSAQFLQVIRMVTVWSTSGPTFFRRRNRSIWILDASFYRRLLGLSTTRMVGDLLKEFKMLGHLIWICFLWLIFMYTICDPWDVKKFNLWNFAIQWLYISIDEDAGTKLPVSKKKL